MNKCIIIWPFVCFLFCISCQKIEPSAISLNKTEITLTEGESVILTVTIEPFNATSRTITWVSSNTTVATVTNGIVVGINPGTTEIVAKVENCYSKCLIKVIPIGAIDLGLSVCWASHNLGASGSEDIGVYYQWGMIEPSGSRSYKWYFEGDYTKITKYFPLFLSDDEEARFSWYGDGSPDGKTILDPEDDAAHVLLGDKWRMPTTSEFTQLLSNCTRTWITQNGVQGFQFKSEITGNSIFLPSRKVTGASCEWAEDYWASTLCYNSTAPFFFCIYDNKIQTGGIVRSMPYAIRPVWDCD